MTTDNTAEPQNKQAAPGLTRLEKFKQEARARANALADSFSLAEALHLEAHGFHVEYDGSVYESEEDENQVHLSFTVARHRGGPLTVPLSFAEINEALQDFIRERFAQRILNVLIAEHLNEKAAE